MLKEIIVLRTKSTFYVEESTQFNFLKMHAVELIVKKRQHAWFFLVTKAIATLLQIIVGSKQDCEFSLFNLDFVGNQIRARAWPMTPLITYRLLVVQNLHFSISNIPICIIHCLFFNIKPWSFRQKTLVLKCKSDCVAYLYTV